MNPFVASWAFYWVAPIGAARSARKSLFSSFLYWYLHSEDWLFVWIGVGLFYDAM